MLSMHDSSFNFSWDFQQRCFPRDSVIVLCWGGGQIEKSKLELLRRNAPHQHERISRKFAKETSKYICSTDSIFCH